MPTSESAVCAVCVSLVALLSGCASIAPSPVTGQASQASVTALSCAFPGNCVSSVGGNGVGPLTFSGTSIQAMATLRTTLAAFPEARITRAEPLELEAIFTTPLGFQDKVDFRIDPDAHRIDYRSRSMFGLFDFGKNRARMRAVAARFEGEGGR